MDDIDWEDGGGCYPPGSERSTVLAGSEPGCMHCDRIATRECNTCSSGYCWRCVKQACRHCPAPTLPPPASLQSFSSEESTKNRMFNTNWNNARTRTNATEKKGARSLSLIRSEQDAWPRDRQCDRSVTSLPLQSHGVSPCSRTKSSRIPLGRTLQDQKRVTFRESAGIGLIPFPISVYVA